jgi:hypothetical protein
MPPIAAAIIAILVQLWGAVKVAIAEAATVEVQVSVVVCTRAVASPASGRPPVTPTAVAAAVRL